MIPASDNFSAQLKPQFLATESGQKKLLEMAARCDMFTRTPSGHRRMKTFFDNPSL
jgi:hypothetical protein